MSAYSEMICDDPAVDVCVEEEFNSVEETIDSENNSNPDFSAASSSSSDASEPVAMKVKVDIPHTREHLGKTYLLSDYGLQERFMLFLQRHMDQRPSRHSNGGNSSVTSRVQKHKQLRESVGTVLRTTERQGTKTNPNTWRQSHLTPSSTPRTPQMKLH